MPDFCYNSSPMSFDHVLMIGFGGPTKPEEIKPFLLNVTRGIPIPEERLREVEHHYHEVGGFEPGLQPGEERTEM